MLQVVRDYLIRIVEGIDAGNTDADEEDLVQIARTLRHCLRKDVPMSKYQAYTYLNISRASFDNMVRDGKIPKGKKIAGFKELVWYKKDLSKIKNT